PHRRTRGRPTDHRRTRPLQECRPRVCGSVVSAAGCEPLCFNEIGPRIHTFFVRLTSTVLYRSTGDGRCACAQGGSAMTRQTTQATPDRRGGELESSE